MLSLSWRSGDSHYEAPSSAALGRDNVEDAPAGRCRTNDRVRSEHARACLRQRNPDQPCGEPRLLGGLLEQRLELLEFIMRIVGWVGLNTSFLRADLSTNYKGSLAGSHFFAHLRRLRLVFTPDELSEHSNAEGQNCGS